MTPSPREPLLLFAIALAALAVSAIHPHDRQLERLDDLNDASCKCPAPQDT